MDPKSFSDYYKKYGSGFLLWCAIFFLYTELSSYKEKVVKIEEKLYGCLERSAYQNAGTETEKELKRKSMTLKERWSAKTPDFWKKVQKIGIACGAVGAAIIAAPVALPAALITAGGYLIAVGGVTATLSQLTKDDAK